MVENKNLIFKTHITQFRLQRRIHLNFRARDKLTFILMVFFACSRRKKRKECKRIKPYELLELLFLHYQLPPPCYPQIVYSKIKFWVFLYLLYHYLSVQLSIYHSIYNYHLQKIKTRLLNLMVAMLVSEKSKD